MRRQYGLGSACLLLFLAVPAFGADAVKLEMKFKEGDKFYVETVSNSKQVVEFAGTKMESETENTQVNSYKVLKSDKDGVVIEQKIESIKSKGGDAASEKILEAMKGATFKLTLNGKGEVAKVEGYDELVKKAGEANELAGKLIKSFLTEESLKSSASDEIAFLPGKALSKGDTWKRSQSTPLGPLGNMTGDIIYTYKGPGKDGEEIAYEQKLEYTAPKEGNDALPFKISKGDMKFEKSTGFITFDATKGRVAKTEATLKMKGTLTIDVAGMSVALAMEMTQTSKSKTLDKSPLD